MTRSYGTGESWVANPLPHEKFFKECDPAFEVEWACDNYNVPMPTFRQTRGTRQFHGSYNPRLETVNYTRPILGVVLHETAHHICHKLGTCARPEWQRQLSWTEVR